MSAEVGSRSRARDWTRARLASAPFGVRVRPPRARRVAVASSTETGRSWRFPRARNRHRGSTETRGRWVRATHRVEDGHDAVGVPVQERLREVHGAPPADLDATPAPTTVASARPPECESASPCLENEEKNSSSFQAGFPEACFGHTVARTEPRRHGFRTAEALAARRRGRPDCQGGQGSDRQAQGEPRRRAIRASRR